MIPIEELNELIITLEKINNRARNCMVQLIPINLLKEDQIYEVFENISDLTSEAILKLENKYDL